MGESLLPFIAGIIVVGVAAQWFAWRVGLPSILLLLLFGLAAGPFSGWLKPDDLFGDLLFPFVSIAVALILYEGGLTLKLSELKKVGAAVGTLVTIGAAVTFVVTFFAARVILDLDVKLAALVGAVLVVTGPTVIAPLLQHIRPTGRVGPILKWEGIVIDPIGALLALLIYEAIQIGEAREATMHAAIGVLKTCVYGGGLGFAAAAILTVLIERHLIADRLENAVSIMLVVASFTLSNHLQHESGLLAVTVMGFVLANQQRADIRHIVEFKENLRVLLISGLFIVLAARLELSELVAVAPRGIAFSLALVLIARPVSVFVSTLGGGLARNERLFLSWMAPRGIVAAAVASIFALRLEESGSEAAATLVPITFITIIVTVIVYGLSAPWVARRLGLAESDPQGMLFVGAHPFAREFAELVQKQGHRVLLVDNNWENINASRMAGLPAYHGSILSEHVLDELDLGGLGRVLAMTPNDWVNILAVQRFTHVFGKANCYQLAPQQQASREKHKFLYGQWLFDEAATYENITNRLADGFGPKSTNLSSEFTFEDFRAEYGDRFVPLCVMDENGRLSVVTSEHGAEPVEGQSIISLVRDRDATL